MKARIIASLILLAVVAVLLERHGCRSSRSPQTGGSFIIPTDTNFAGSRVSEYRPPSLPFQQDNPPVSLPEGVRAKDVDRVVGITLAPSDLPRRLDLIETKDGMVYLRKDSTLVSLSITRYLPPLVAFNPRVLIGVSGSFPSAADRPRVLPVAGFSALDIAGSLHVPVIALDPDGVGVGLGGRFYHDLSLGAVRSWEFDGAIRYKALLYYSF